MLHQRPLLWTLCFNYLLHDSLALGQRVIKTTTSGTTVFQYDSSGKLIAESDAQGNVTREYVYLNDIPVAVFQ